MRSAWAPACRARRRWRNSPKRCRVACRVGSPMCPSSRQGCRQRRRRFPARQAAYQVACPVLAGRGDPDCRVLAAFRALAKRNSSCPSFPPPRREGGDAIDQSTKGRRMSLKIRMARAGTKKRPVYHIVVADSRYPRDGRFIERLGYFNPLMPKDNAERLKFDIEKAKSWLAKGATPSDRILRFLDAAGVRKRPARSNPERAVPRKERKARAEAAAKAAAAAPKPAAAAPKPAA